MSEKIENLRKKADQLITGGKWNELIQVATELINLNKEPHDKAIAYCMRGSTYLKKGEYNRALEDFTKSTKLNPKYVDAYCGRGDTYLCKSEYDRALEDFSKAIRLNPEYADAYHGRGSTYISKSESDRALEDFNKAIELNPEYTDAYYGCGIAYINKQNFDSAVTSCNEAIELNPEHVCAHYACGFAYLNKSDFGNAFKKFNTVAEKCPVLKTSEPFVYIASRIKAIDSLGESEQIKAFEIYISLLYIVSEIRFELFYTSKELESGVAHYTSLHTLRNLSEKRECFRLYNADYMNDPEEGQVFFKIMNKKYGIDIGKDFYENKDKSYRSPAYIGSFVLFEGEDKLSLWRTYGKHDTKEAAGACLIFNNEQCFSEKMSYHIGSMTESLQSPDISQQLANMTRDDAIDFNNVQKLELYKIYYLGKSDDELEKELQELRNQLKNTEDIMNNEAQKKKIKEKLEILEDQLKVIEKIINNGIREEKIKKELQQLGKPLQDIKQFIEKVPKEEGTKNTLRRLVRELLDSIRFLFKERYYRDEKERRVILWRYGERDKSSESKIKTDTENIPPRFYTEAPENFRFSEVILGPNAKHVQQWQRWFKAQDENIEIDKSEIPYGKS